VLRQFKLSAVFGEVLRFHAPEIKEEALTRGQPFVLAVPISKLDERILAAELVLVSVLSLKRQRERQLIRLRVHRGELGDHPVVKLGIRKLVREEIAYLLSVGDLRILNVEFFAGDTEVPARVKAE
jgi:hypothetical protein